MRQIPYGYCHCGCGEKTNISKWDNKRRGHIKGEPYRFIRGHQSGYSADNRRDRGGDRLFPHRIIAEGVLGGLLPKGANVHHVDGNHENNSKNNLVICENNAYHALLHQRMRALNACGHKNWLTCNVCHQYDFRENLYMSADGQSRWHRECRREYAHQNYLRLNH